MLKPPLMPAASTKQRSLQCVVSSSHGDADQLSGCVGLNIVRFRVFSSQPLRMSVNDAKIIVDACYISKTASLVLSVSCRPASSYLVSHRLERIYLATNSRQQHSANR